jgi:hypothetical protein
VMSCARAGCAGTANALVKVRVAEPWGIVVQNGIVYFTDASLGTISSCSADPTMCANNPVTLATLPPLTTDAGTSGSMPSELAIDATFLYWADQGKGEIAKCPITNCAANITVLASGQKAPTHLAIDDKAVYWAEWVAGGSVRKVAK